MLWEGGQFQLLFTKMRGNKSIRTKGTKRICKAGVSTNREANDVPFPHARIFELEATGHNSQKLSRRSRKQTHDIKSEDHNIGDDAVPRSLPESEALTTQ